MLAHAAALRVLRSVQIVTPATRHARCRAAEYLRRARRGSTAAPVASLGVTSAAVAPLLESLGGGFALLSRPMLLQRVRQSSHRAPPTAPPSVDEGDLWGDLQAVGQVTGSLLRLLGTPPIPNPFP
jgi:hypothetical protein